MREGRALDPVPYGEALIALSSFSTPCSRDLPLCIDEECIRHT